MPPKTKFTKNDVCNAGFELLSTQGFKALSARNIAQKLNSSTAPVYASYQNMTTLVEDCLKMGIEKLISYTNIEYTDIPFRNMGLGIVMFARENSVLYKSLFLESNLPEQYFKPLMERARELLRKDKRISGIPDEAIDELIEKIWIYTHGLAAFVCTNMLEHIDEEYIQKNISEIGALIISHVMKKYQNI